VPDGPIDAQMVAYLEEAFGEEHERTYGHRAGADEPVELVTIQVVGQGVRTDAAVPKRMHASRAEPSPPPARRAYFGKQTGWVQTPVIRRSDLSSPRQGPVIVEEYDATCVIAPGWHAQLDVGGNIVMEAT